MAVEKSTCKVQQETLETKQFNLSVRENNFTGVKANSFYANQLSKNFIYGVEISIIAAPSRKVGRRDEKNIAVRIHLTKMKKIHKKKTAAKIKLTTGKIKWNGREIAIIFEKTAAKNDSQNGRGYRIYGSQKRKGI